MPQIIEELIAIVKLDVSQPKKAAAEAKKATEQVKRVATVSAEDQERINKSTETRAKERDQRREKVRKQKERDEQKQVRESSQRAQEYGDKIKGIAVGMVGAFLGFESIKGAVNFFNGISTATASLGRDAANVGVTAHEMQTLGNAIEMVGGDSKEALSSFSALSQSLTGAMLRGESSPLIQLMQSFGVHARDAEGKIRPLKDILLELGSAMQKRGLSRPNEFNLLSGAGVSEGLINLMLNKNASKILADADRNATLTDANTDQAADIGRRSKNLRQRISAKVTPVALNAADAAMDFLDNPRQILSDVASDYKDMFKGMFAPKNNNPGNIKARPGQDADARGFAIFDSLTDGYSAIDRQLNLYASGESKAAHHKKINTIRGIVNTYAPASDNNDVDAYVKDLVKRVGVGADVPLEDHGAQRFALIQAMVAHEGTFKRARATPTPNASMASGAAGGADHSVTVTTGPVTVVSQATDAKGIATDFMGAMKDKGSLVAQYNNGMTP